MRIPVQMVVEEDSGSGRIDGAKVYEKISPK